MQQSNVIFGALLLGFIVFITTKGELPSYLNLLRGVGAPAASASATPASSGASSLLTNSDPVSQLLSNPSQYGIPQVSGIFLNGDAP
jgi:hypothetical protein